VASVPNERQTSQSLLKSLLIALCCGLFYFCWIHPSRQQLEDARNNISSIRLTLAEKEHKEDRLAHSSTLLENQQRQLAKMLSILRKQPPSPLQILQDLASSNEIEIGWSTPSQRGAKIGGDTRPISHKNITVELAGQYLNLRNYFEDVCQLEWSLGIESCEIEARPEPNESTNLRAKLVLRVPTFESYFHETLAEN